MKIWLMFVLLLCLMAVSGNGLSQQTVDERAVTNACFDKFFQDIAVLNKKYKHIELESSKDEPLGRHEVEYKERFYEYRLVKDVMMRRLLKSNEKIYESDKEFQSFHRDLELNRSFFDRFEYRFKQRITKQGVSVLVFQFFPKPNLPEDNYLYRTINKLVGEIEIDDKDLALLAFRASLPAGTEVEYAEPPLAGARVQSATVFMETTEREGLILVGNLKVEVRHSSSLLFFTSYSKYTKIVELKSVERVNEQNEGMAPTASSEVARDHELSDGIWRTRKLVWYLVVLGLVVFVPFLLWHRFGKRKNPIPR